MSSETPSYYPEGWDRERLLNVGITNDIHTLTEDQLAVFREGLRADKGEQGFEEFFDEMWKREKVAKGTKAIFAFMFPNHTCSPPSHASNGFELMGGPS